MVLAATASATASLPFHSHASVVLVMGAVCLLVLALIVIFYKELLVTTFDPALAATLGMRPALVHYALMAALSVVVVSAFRAVGAILVVAMLILPGATASLPGCVRCAARGSTRARCGGKGRSISSPRISC